MGEGLRNHSCTPSHAHKRIHSSFRECTCGECADCEGFHYNLYEFFLLHNLVLAKKAKKNGYKILNFFFFLLNHQVFVTCVIV